MKNIKNIASLLIDGILGGMMIGIGGTVFLMVDNKIVGSLLFSIGLLTILVFNLGLYTGKVGYLFINKNINQNVIIILFTLIGNFVGTNITVMFIKATRLFSIILIKNTDIVSTKLSDTPLSLFVLSVFCGLLMFIGVDSFKSNQDKNVIVSVLMPILCVSVFILCGFEHSIADMFYFALQGGNYIIRLLVIIIGNAIGGNILPVLSIVKSNLVNEHR